jgi:menaquinone-9 beta-reductase
LYTARIVIGAYGKRSGLDKQLQRPFAFQASPWLGVKAHYQADFPEGLVALHNFYGGYCGLSQVENKMVNVCYLTHYRSFRQHKNIAEFQQQVLFRNPFLKDFFARATPLFRQPLAISQISFSRKQSVEKHVLMCGDSAGLIHPLCGNGMAMAMHSAKIAAEQIIAFFQHKTDSRSTLEKQYAAAWKQAFSRRMRVGRWVQTVLQQPRLSSLLLGGIRLYPGIVREVIRQTHGKPLS